MKRAGLGWALSLGLVLAAGMACGDDGGNAGASSSSGDPVVPPTAAPFGLDARPANATCHVPARPALDTAVRFEPAFPGLTFATPTYIAQAPGDDTRFYVLEKGGALKTFTRTTTTNAAVTNFATFTVNTDIEGGLLGLAFPPDFATTRYLYVSYTAPAAVTNYGTNMRSRVVRMHSANGIVADGGMTTMFDVGQPYANHDGGNIQFGPDGMLYLGLGDGGLGNDPLLAGQNLTMPLGKMLRFDVRDTTATTAGIPTDNPFFNAANARSCNGFEPPAAPGDGAGPCKEIWAYGFRNPWRWSFDRESGELWVGDVGQDTWEEIDARVQKGGNYGWNLCEGNHARGSTTMPCPLSSSILPIVEHPRTEAQSITGGYVYRGNAIPALRGTYVYGDYVTGNVWAIVYDDKGAPASRILGNVGAGKLTSFGQGNDGEVYLVVGAEIQRLAQATAPDAGAGGGSTTFPQTLSATGCFAPGDATKPGDALIPYDLISTLWSDGADKKRYMALPDGQVIRVLDDGDWDFPIGTVLIKTFSVGGKRIETRLFMRHDDGGWAGYSYEWNDAGTDATLLPASKQKNLGSQNWTYPSRTQCLQCHTNAANGALGPDTTNMNRDEIYPATNRVSPQLATLEHIGLFGGHLPHGPPAIGAFASPADATQGIEARARAYLHTNCSHCHRPGGGGQGPMDLRWTTPFADTKTCNQPNSQGVINGASVIIAPGIPARSVMAQRIHATDSKRMPPVAVSIPDPLGTQLIDDYISSIAACP